MDGVKKSVHYFPNEEKIKKKRMNHASNKFNTFDYLDNVCENIV